MICHDSKKGASFRKKINLFGNNEQGHASSVTGSISNIASSTNNNNAWEALSREVQNIMNGQKSNVEPMSSEPTRVKDNGNTGPAK